MLTRHELTLPQFTGDWRVDGPALFRALLDFKRKLDDKGALVINEAEITANQGIKFPATQVASSDANTLDDYEESDSWTPSITFATPGNLSVTYTTQIGDYTKIGREVRASFLIVTSGFTHTTASGALFINGLPFTANSAQASMRWQGQLRFAGITKANYTSFDCWIGAGGTAMGAVGSGSGQATSAVTAADMPTGGSVVLSGTIIYPV
jgi:hypothetical protein